MIRSAAILFSIVGISSLYGEMLIKHPYYFNLLSYHVLMVLFDSLIICRLKDKHVPFITNPLVFVLSVSIVNHSFGGAWWFYGKEGYLYDLGRQVILALELFVLIGGTFCHVVNRRHRVHDWPRISGIFVVESDKCD